MKTETVCNLCNSSHLDIELHIKDTHYTTSLQHCGTCNKKHSSWENPTPTRQGYCSWCWSSIKVNA